MVSNSNTDRLVSVIVAGILIAQALVTVDYSNSNTDGQVLVIVVIILCFCIAFALPSLFLFLVQDVCLPLSFSFRMGGVP